MALPPNIALNIKKKGAKKADPRLQSAAQAMLARQMEDKKDGGKDDAKENRFGKVVKK